MALQASGRQLITFLDMPARAIDKEFFLIYGSLNSASIFLNTAVYSYLSNQGSASIKTKNIFGVFLYYQILLAKEAYQKTVYERESDSTLQENTSAYVFTLHTRHATYLQ